jgi:hypothetical protein
MLGRRIDRANESDLPYLSRRDRAQFVDPASEHHAIEEDQPWLRGAEVDPCKKESRAQSLDGLVCRCRLRFHDLVGGHNILIDRPRLTRPQRLSTPAYTGSQQDQSKNERLLDSGNAGYDSHDVSGVRLVRHLVDLTELQMQIKSGERRSRKCGSPSWL